MYPSLAIFNILKKKEDIEQVLYLGTRGRAEEKIVPGHDIRFHPIRSAPIEGQSRLGKLRSLFIIFLGMFQALSVLWRFKPNLVIGSGGYVCAPVIAAAFLLKPILKLKIVMDEQNMVPGKLNKAASLMADLVLLNHKESNYYFLSNRCVRVGYPVRAQYLENKLDKAAARKRVNVPEDRFLVLVTGGSFGARSINRALPRTLAELAKEKNIHIVHSIGLANTDQYKALPDTRHYLKKNLGPDFDPETLTAKNSQGEIFYQGFGYLDNMFEWQIAADLIISRAGAGALAEIMALGKPSVIVPKRGLSGDHQEMNAIDIAEKKACVPLFENKDPESGLDVLDPEEIADLILTLSNSPERLGELAKNARASFFPDCNRAIHRAVMRVVKGEPVNFLYVVTLPKFVRLQLLFDNMISYLDTITESTPPEQWEDNLYYQYYLKRLPEYLTSSHYLVVNKGIKLTGALKRKERYGQLMDRFQDFQGYLKRNTLQAFGKAPEFDPVFKDAVQKGIRDSYYETRREAVTLFIRFYADFPEDPDLNAKILSILTNPLESFEVKAKAIEACALFLEEADFMERTKKFLSSRNIRLRQALLRAVQRGLEKGKFSDPHEVMRFLKRMLVTTSEFSPEFRIKKEFNRVIESLDKNGGDHSHD